eukprot:gene3407-2766_t
MRAKFAADVDQRVPSARRPGDAGATLAEVERELVAAVRSAADEVLGPKPCPGRVRLGWQAAHAERLHEMATARRELAERRDLSADRRRALRRELHREQRAEIRRLIASWWDERLRGLHTNPSRLGKKPIERLERDAGL